MSIKRRYTVDVVGWTTLFFAAANDKEAVEMALNEMERSGRSPLHSRVRIKDSHLYDTETGKEVGNEPVFKDEYFVGTERKRVVFCDVSFDKDSYGVSMTDVLRFRREDFIKMIGLLVPGATVDVEAMQTEPYIEVARKIL